jgi:hypothetical protein
MRRRCGGWWRRSAARSPTDIPAGFLVGRWFSLQGGEQPVVPALAR